MEKGCLRLKSPFQESACLTGLTVNNAVQNIGGNMMISLRVATENLLRTEPGWIGLNQPITLTGLDAAVNNMIVIVTQGSPVATINGRVVEIAEENTRLAAPQAMENGHQAR